MAMVAVFATACGTSTATRHEVQVAPLPPQAVVDPGPSARDLLDTERARLAELFKGTPVVFITTSDGNLRATVPRRYCFEPGAVAVKPALGAVLGRLAKGQAGTASHFRINVPSDPNARSLVLANDRALSVRDWMATQGIAPTRLQVDGSTQAEQLELFVIPQPAT